MILKEKDRKNKITIRNVKKQIKGITLIALVVTVIVLLILAGVAINLTVGDNGLFRRAQNAADTWQMAEQNEQSVMEQAADFIDNYITRVDGVPIPKGFYYVGGAKETGLVISDNPTDKDKYSSVNWADQVNIPAGRETDANGAILGNQFVWVPVEDSSIFKTYPGYYEEEIKNESFINCIEPAEEEYRYDTEVKEYNAMKLSIEQNKGFYVGRFEAGRDGETIVVRPDSTVWNYIAWGNSMNDIGNLGAVYRAKNMYTDKEKYKVTSTLIYGVEWDSIMTWIDPTYINADGECNSSVSNSTVKGNYNEVENNNLWKGSLTLCGSSDDYRIKNIYDLAGNAWEWTMESYAPDRRNLRGGYYNSNGSYAPASSRLAYYPYEDEWEYIGFRVALYL